MTKKTLCIVLAAAVLLCVSGFAYAADPESSALSPVEIQKNAHEIAETARMLGLPEANPIIREAQRIWWEAEGAKKPAPGEYKSCGFGRYWSESDAVMLAKLIYTEARGVESRMEKAAVVWTVLNRVDDGGSTVRQVVTAPYQFAYSEDAPTSYCGEDFLALARDVLGRWSMEKDGATDTGRVLPAGYLWFSGDGVHNYFRNSYTVGTRWDWSLENPYDD